MFFKLPCHAEFLIFYPCGIPIGSISPDGISGEMTPLILMNMKKMNDKLESSFVKNEPFIDVKQTANQLKDKLDDELEIVARNIKENKDKMGEMKKRFELAMERLGKIKLEDKLEIQNI